MNAKTTRTYRANADKVVLLKDLVASEGGLSVDLETKVDLQDAFAHLDRETMRTYYSALGRTSRRNLIWLAFICLAQDEAIEFLKTTVLHEQMVEMEQHADMRIAAEAETRRQAEQERDQMAAMLNDTQNRVDALLAELAEASKAVAAIAWLKQALA